MTLVPLPLTRHSRPYSIQFRKSPHSEVVGEAGPEETAANEAIGASGATVAAEEGSPKTGSPATSLAANLSSRQILREPGSGRVPNIRIFLLESGPDVESIISTEKVRISVPNLHHVRGKMFSYQDNEKLTSSVKIKKLIHYTKMTNFKK